MGLSTRDFGKEIEQLARKYLEKQGLVFREANYQCKPGEIDLIMAEADCLIFVEVRYRRSSTYGDGAASISSWKRSKLIRSAKHYLVSIDKYDKIPCRFDVMDVRGVANDYQFDWIRDAFQVAH